MSVHLVEHWEHFPCFSSIVVRFTYDDEPYPCGPGKTVVIVLIKGFPEDIPRITIIDSD